MRPAKIKFIPDPADKSHRAGKIVIRGGAFGHGAKLYETVVLVGASDEEAKAKLNEARAYAAQNNIALH